MSGDDKDQAVLRLKLESLILEHRDLDDVIGGMSSSSSSDLLRLQRLKKRKLVLKDEIRYIESKLLPDIIA